MRTEALLPWMLAIQIGLVVLLIVALIVATASRLRRHRDAQGRLPAARAALARAVDDGTSLDELRDALAHLPAEVSVGLLADAGAAVAGAGRRRIAAVAHEAGLLAQATAQCTSRRWWRRLQGVRLLTIVGGADPAAARLLDDPHDEVRAAAATWAADHPGPAIIERLISMLDDERPICRFAAKSALLRMGRPVVAPLVARLAGSPAGRIDGVLEVAVGVAEPALLPAALEYAHHRLPGVRARAAAIAGGVGGSAASDRLITMLDDEDGGVRAAAAVALGRLAYWPAAPRLAAALRDPSWAMRRSAAIALRAMGPTGQLVLRECLDDPDAFARDIAHQVLDLPVSTVQAASG